MLANDHIFGGVDPLSATDIENRVGIVGTNLYIGRDHAIFPDRHRGTFAGAYHHASCGGYSITNTDMAGFADAHVCGKGGIGKWNRADMNLRAAAMHFHFE